MKYHLVIENKVLTHVIIQVNIDIFCELCEGRQKLLHITLFISNMQNYQISRKLKPISICQRMRVRVNGKCLFYILQCWSYDTRSCRLQISTVLLCTILSLRNLLNEFPFRAMCLKNQLFSFMFTLTRLYFGINRLYYQMCLCFFTSASFLTPTGCPLIQFNFDTGYLKLAQGHQFKDSVPQY